MGNTVNSSEILKALIAQRDVLSEGRRELEEELRNLETKIDAEFRSLGSFRSRMVYNILGVFSPMMTLALLAVTVFLLSNEHYVYGCVAFFVAYAWTVNSPFFIYARGASRRAGVRYAIASGAFTADRLNTTEPNEIETALVQRGKSK